MKDEEYYAVKWTLISCSVMLIGLALGSYILLGITTGEWNPYQMYLDHQMLMERTTANVTITGEKYAY